MTNKLDKISQLPRDITDQILSRLPIKEAVRTSILSRKWRYKWSSVPQLVFDDRCTNCRGVPSLLPSLHENLVKIIDKVLLLHTGPIQKFKLSHKEFCAPSDIDHWIVHLSRVSIKEIILDIWKGQYYKIPTSLFNCQELIHMELYRCLVKIPSTFEGLMKLESLDLQYVELSQDGLEALISLCPLLKCLKLRNLEGITRVNIKARNLKLLDLRGAFQDVAFGFMKRLKSVTIGFSDDIANKRGPNHANSSNLHKLFRHLPKIQSLKFENYSLKYLAAGNVPQTLPNEPVHLNYLFTCIDFNSVEEILTVLCLIRSSPQLKQIDFQNRAKDQQTTRIGTMAGFWEDHHACCLEQVQVVSMVGISGSERELELMKFMLTSTSNLQKMMIRPNSTSGEGKLLRELLRSRRASAQAEVIFL
ncbi:F-box/FBD/LRR-repeat protein At1g13570-like [Syzygium oleosum]|uniref:F-box/FBD/LRR-repeat protein At1g13570-like n=1 Tax=Syzygium oleosum TaxID=219896 RepID=UPI0011D20343|nr:F-box/FBD/LRR-repeat protein At1g13570-like [Syzygium oleosum]